MDDTQHSRASEAAATRKRRSSILKSQRSSRAPFSELEFNVATPTDTTKSRRVSFSKKTGVAEFVTNEATTTWKNFYEEQNKSLESSGNESAAIKPPRPSVGHLGQRMFVEDQEIEAVDFGCAMNDTRGIENSMNNVKFDQFTLEYTSDDRKLLAPGQNFELSDFTVSEQPSKLFGDDMGISGMGTITDKISQNFSTMQPLGDDLDEIERDVGRHQANSQNFVCPDPQNNRRLSEYIEVDLNITHANLGSPVDISTEDMSITDTIHSPKVNVSTNIIAGHSDKSVNKDWVADKENIVINPYVAPKESVNFALNEESDKILVFDGKRLKLQSEKEPISEYRKTLLPSNNDPPNTIPSRKTIILNVDDDLPNFIANPHTSLSQHMNNATINKTLLGNDCDISVTQPVLHTIETNSDKRRTIVFEDNSCNISITQALPTNIAPEMSAKLEKRQTMLFDEHSADISVTQALTANIILSKNGSQVRYQERETKIFEDSFGDISLTQANIVLPQKPEKESTVANENQLENLSITRALPTNIILPESENDVLSQKGKTIIFDETSADISMTQVVPTNKAPEKRRTILFDNNLADISVTQAVPANILISQQQILENEVRPEKRKTIVFEEDACDISLTQSLPTNMILSIKRQSVINETVTHKTEGEVSVIETVKSKIAMFDKQDENMAPSEAIQSNTIMSEDVIQHQKKLEQTQKRKTIVFDDEDGNISFTKPIPANLILPVERTDEQKNLKTVEANVTNLNLCSVDDLSSKFEIVEKQKDTVYFDEMQYFEDIAISMSQALPSNIISSEKKKVLVDVKDSVIDTRAVPDDEIITERKSICKDDLEDMVTTEAKPNQIIAEIFMEPKGIVGQSTNISTSEQLPKNDSLLEITEPISVTQANVIFECKDIVMDTLPKNNRIIEESEDVKINISKIYEHENTRDISMTEDAPNINKQSEVTALLEKVKCKETTTEINVTSELPETLNNDKADVSMSEEFKRTKYMFADFSMSDVIYGSQCKVVQKCFEKPDQKCELEKSNLNNTVISEGNMDVKTVMVYQTTTTTTTFKPEMRKESVLSTISSVNSSKKSDTEPSSSVAEDIGSADYVTVSKGVPIPSSKIDFIIDIDKKQNLPFAINISELNVGLVNTENSVSTLSQDALPNTDYPILKCYNVCSDTERTSPQNNSDSDINFGLVQSSTAVSAIQQTVEQTILDDLLDMGDRTYSGVMDKSVMALIPETVKSKILLDTQSSEKFYIIRDSDHETQTDKSDDDKDLLKNPANHNLNPLKINLQNLSPHKSNKDIEKKLNNQSPRKTELDNCVKDIQKKLLELTQESDVQIHTENKYYEEVVSSGKNKASDLKRKSYVDADSTKYLLDMLSKFTENEEKDDPMVPITEKSMPEYVPERRMSLPRRRSVVLSQEDILHNISTARAMMQHAGAPDAGSDPDLDTSSDKTPSPKSRARICSEVVKTLRFEDDELSSDPIENITTSPLKKTAFGETSYMTAENRNGHVIPTYLKDVSDGIKTLMTDLMKPMTDVFPFDTGRERQPEQKASQCSMNIQADVPASSQVDLPESSSHSLENTKKIKSIIKASAEKFDYSNTTLSSAKSFIQECESKPIEHGKPAVIRFDPENPLNNVLLAPVNFNEAHKYKPLLQEDSLTPSVHRISNVSFKDAVSNSTQSDNVHNTQYNVHRVIPDFSVPLNNVSLKKASEVQTSSLSTVADKASDCIPLTVERSAETVTSFKDKVINTAIAMQDTKKLLEDISSLTLVDSSCEQDSPSEDSLDNTSPTSASCSSPMEAICRQKSDQLDTVTNSHENIEEKKKTDKRKYKKSTVSAQDATPKPASKIPKRSLSPTASKTDNTDKASLQSDTDRTKAMKRSPPKEGKSPKKKSPRNNPERKVIVQQLTVENDMKNLTKLPVADAAKDCETDDGDRVKQSVSSLSSKDMGDYTSVEDVAAGGMDWQPALVHEGSSAALVAQHDAGTDVAAHIDRLPFMGSDDCSWESSDDGVWSFRLLRRRLRLVVRLARTHPPWTRVRADTPISGITVEPVYEISNKKSAIVGAVCSNLALEALRRWAAAGGAGGGGGGAASTAGEVPGVLRRAAGVARAAAQWARAMTHAWRHLAYRLRADGRLTITVANVPLRSVWEVSMQIELACTDPTEMAWPRCSLVDVAPVVARVAVSLAELQRCCEGVPPNWGHAPNTLWKVFRYLKNKSADEPLRRPV